MRSSSISDKVYIPSTPRKDLALFLKRVANVVPGLHVADVDIPLNVLCKDDQKLEQVALGREFHISLGRTVPIRVHQIDSVLAMLRQKLQSQKRYWIDFSKWEVFVNDEQTRTFLSMEVTTGGLVEIHEEYFGKLKSSNARPMLEMMWAVVDNLIRYGFVVQNVKHLQP
ncbi:U6 snRNA phosphodiesterase Usb1 [Macleaya cordata]|uniref:U6 snRNA phosphodiesterase 1 n=1 Tax=Macleaya cordata TaxID=56857 RepID=A0A200RAQ3_MACCD|nr:U6 snRNA phosphodiesterase Usb1 [Macleaya cordata]